MKEFSFKKSRYRWIKENIQILIVIDKKLKNKTLLTRTQNFLNRFVSE